MLVSYREDKEQIERIKSDLVFISELTGNCCACNENKTTVMGLRHPQELFDERLDQQIDYGDDGPLSAALNNLETGTEAYILLKQYIDSPIPDALIQAFNDPIIAPRFREQYPGLEYNPTIGNLVNIGWKKNRKLVGTEEYGKLRKAYQDGLGINKNAMVEQKDPFSHIKKLHSKFGFAKGFDLDKYSNDKISSSWFQDIYKDYIMLDLNGYHQDKIKVNEKNKDTMRNTIDDGFHASFASMCDFYITNDKKSIWKTKEVYKKQNINTKVLSPVEFVTHFDTYLNYKNPQAHLLQWFEILKGKEFIVSQIDNDVQMTFHLNYFLFDYFNKANIVYKDGCTFPLVLLTKEKPTNNKFIYRNEVSELINKLNFAFNVINEEDRFLEPDDISFENWRDYDWTMNDYAYKLIFREGYLQLYMDMSEVWNKA